MSNFQVGDVVVLNSGGPLMTVTDPAFRPMGSDQVFVAVVWFKDNVVNRDSFLEAVLQKDD
ncbi:DUF2158 domain-containing protein [Comamonas koreensis]|uniref:DUF2158 domain-containing protein n=1 Tax=Comamonas koreensis TaxID=160825 RepID=UPI0015FBCD80|nr:DUF2158 domain-containing protein [Comamonas koreensis]